MRIVRFTPGPDAGLGQDPLFGVLEDDATISIISGDPIYSGIQKTAAKIELNKVRLLAPIIPRSKVVCVGKNYADHAAEMGGVVPDEPIIFLKPTAEGFSNTGTGAVPVTTGSVSVNSDLPSASGSSTIAISSASISGSMNVNQVLTAVQGTVSNSASYTTTYQWRRAGVAIPSANSSTYTLTSDDIGSGISVTITVQDGSASAFATSASTAPMAKLTPTFNAWSNISKNFGNSAFTVTAPTEANSVPGTFTYSSGTPSVISVSGTTLTVVGAGSSVITATFTPNDTTNYNTATTTMTVTVGKATPTFSSWSNVSKNFGDSAFTVTAPTVTGSVPGTFIYSSATTSVISVLGTTLSVVGAGSSIITATFTPTPDPITMTLLAIPLCLIYFLSGLFALLTDRRRSKKTNTSLEALPIDKPESI